jgi:dTDP-4-dehydrorhamnose 3,5-epimerase-like enzyme
MTTNALLAGRLQRQVVRGDVRGNLVAIEGARDVPFAIARVYYLYGTKSGEARGFHAHRTLRQWAVCVAGSCTMMLDDGYRQELVTLDDPATGVAIEPMVWHEMRDFAPGTVLLVLADQPYDESDYIRDYPTFRAAIGPVEAE